MIHYSLRCGHGHEFDGWFASSAAFERQREGDLLGCPACGSADVSRALMTPALSRNAALAQRTAKSPAEPATPEPATPTPNVALVDERSQKMRALMRSIRETVLEHGADVGRSFPEEARRIHYGDAEPRGIYGQADHDEARELIEEGIAILPLPNPDDTN